MFQRAMELIARIVRRPRSGPTRVALSLSLLTLIGFGCARSDGDSSPPGAPTSEAGGESGLALPPDFKPVDRPLEERKEIHAEAYHLRARVMNEANAIMPMDDAHMPKNGNQEFDKRMAEHKAILDPILEKGMAEIAQKHGVTVADVAKIEEEANRLRWTPPPAVDEAKTKGSN
ncbi:MAG: hypothetical protein AB7I30_11115 [Isosphaeraceae bacterium]